MSHPPRYSASIEWIRPTGILWLIRPRVGILRLHPGPDGQVGDPFVWSCVVERRGGTGVIRGVCKPLPRGGPSAVVAALLAHGMATRCYQRPGRDGDARWVLKPNRSEPATGAD